MSDKDPNISEVWGGGLLSDQRLSIGSISGGADTIQYDMPRTITLFKGDVHVTYVAENVTKFEGTQIFGENPIPLKASNTNS